MDFLLNYLLLLSSFIKEPNLKILRHFYFSFTFNIPSNHIEKRSIKNIFPYFKQSIHLIWKKSEQLNPKYPIIENILYYELIFFHSTKEYLSNVFGISVNGIFKSSPPNLLNLFEKIILSLFITINLLFSIVLYPLSKRYLYFNLSLNGLDIVANSIVIKYIKKKKIKKLLIFDAYERDIPLLCYILKKLNVETHLFPSANPIKNFYKLVYADKFWFSAPFQIYEAKELMNNWNVKELGIVPLYDFYKIKKYETGTKYKYKIGIISTGTMIREKMNLSTIDKNLFTAEKVFLHTIKELIDIGYIQKDEILIYLHPKEKRNLEIASNLYHEIFGFKINFAPIDIPTNQCFDLCEIGIAVMSTAQMERLFGGFKCIYAPLSIYQLNFSDPRLEKIIAKNKNELINLINLLSKMTEKEFFEEFNLWDYHHTKFDKFPLSLDDKISL
jgi:hypothetical protein